VSVVREELWRRAQIKSSGLGAHLVATRTQPVIEVTAPPEARRAIVEDGALLSGISMRAVAALPTKIC